MSLLHIAKAVVSLLMGQSRLVRLRADRTIVFIGDTHGDIDATEKVLARYPIPDCTLVFLGDAVDRGPDSAGNLRLILQAKLDHPTSIHLLMGNHEAWAIAPFTPADFWNGLDTRESETIAKALTHLPLAAHHPAGVLGLHGALPNLPSLDALDSIEIGSTAWRAITWGDWLENRADRALQPTSRPGFERADFDARAARFDLQVLVRSHQPSAPTYLYEDHCLTIFSSSAYGDGRRTVAILPPDRRVSSALDLEIQEIA